jgi:ACS family hexuronate transporter-like MFS transporter
MIRADAISEAPFEDSVGWFSLLNQRRIWALVLAKLICDPLWYFYMFWLPDYFQRGRGFTLKEIALYGWLPYLAADLGGIGGGGFSDWLIRRGMQPLRARTVLIVAASCVTPLGALAGLVRSHGAVLLVATVGVMLVPCWNANTLTLATEIVPRSRVAWLIGMMGTAGSIGGILFAQVLASVIVRFSYPAAFVLAALLMPIGTSIMMILLRPWRCHPGERAVQA